MRVLTVGGGSGGHVTPILAVINELHKLDPELIARFICDKQFEEQSRGLMKRAAIPVPVQTILAGKLRRYHNVSLWRQLLDVKTVGHNLVDSFKVVFGICQSLIILKKFKPDVVFAKGGFVCLPMGWAARLLKIPLVIHDSDTRPGLTNRLLSRFAARIGTGTPLENYTYPKAISSYVGVPIDSEYHPLTHEEQQKAKAAIGLVDLTKPLIVAIGGGLGAKSINDAVIAAAPTLLSKGYSIYHVTGKKHFEACEAQAPAHAGYQLVPFVYKQMVTVLGAADVIVSRASATFLQELAALQKPTIVIPAAQLGDQIKNAEVYEKAKAAVVLSDDQLVNNPGVLVENIIALLDDPKHTRELASSLHAFAMPEAALNMAQLIVDVAHERMRKD